MLEQAKQKFEQAKQKFEPVMQKLEPVTQKFAPIKQRVSSLLKKSSGHCAVGVALHPDSLDIVILDKAGDKFQVQSATRIVCELSHWEEGLSQAFKELELENSACQIVLAGMQYQVMQIDKPQVPDEELGAALKWSVKDILPNSDELAMDYFDIPAQSMGMSKINLVTSKLEHINKTIKVTEKLELQGITIEELSICNLLPAESEATLLLTQQPGEDLRVMVVKDGALFFTRTVAGFAHLVNVHDEMAFVGLGDSLSLEVQRSMDYFEAQLRQAPVQRILVGLPVEYNEIILNSVKQNFDIDIQPFNSLTECLSSENLPDYLYYPALGAALEVARGEVH